MSTADDASQHDLEAEVEMDVDKPAGDDGPVTTCRRGEGRADR
jgi:hypothetical protein